MLPERKVIFSEVTELADQIAPEIMNDSLFDEVSDLNQILASIPPEKFEQMSPEEKWMKVFKSTLPCLYRVVSIIFSIPVSNAFAERVFSLCNVQWTKERNLLHVDTVQSLIQTKVNYDYSCIEMFNMLLSNTKLLDKIGGWEKYK